MFNSELQKWQPCWLECYVHRLHVKRWNMVVQYTNLTWSSGEHSSLGSDSIRKSISLEVLAIRVANKAACPKNKVFNHFEYLPLSTITLTSSPYPIRLCFSIRKTKNYLCTNVWYMNMKASTVMHLATIINYCKQIYRTNLRLWQQKRNSETTQ